VKPLVVRIAVALAAAAGSLALGEIVVRALGVAPGFAAIPFGQYVTSADAELLWEPRAGADGVNAAGLRGPEPAAEKTRPRLLILGDSIAWGLDLTDDETISARLQARLAEAGQQVEVLNGGVSGYNTVQAARRLELLAPRVDPDHVVLLVCVNDVDPIDALPEGVLRFARRNDAADALERVHVAGRASRLRRELLSRSHLFRLLHEALAGRAQPRADEARELGELPLGVVAEGLTRIASTAALHGFTVTVATVPLLTELPPEDARRRFHGRVLALARERGLETLDLLPIVLADAQRAPSTLCLPGDPLHPNAAGADLIATALAERWSERRTRAIGD
jgi:lysophospholipase L1-like esterase